MLIAQKLKQENAVEYILYMWQLEDIIRANDFDITNIETLLVNRYNQPDDVKLQIKSWYQNLIQQMIEQDIKNEGHLIETNVMLQKLNELHLKLLESDTNYLESYYKILPLIVELRAKSGDKKMPEIETCISALYGFLMIKLQKKEISGETHVAMSQITSFLRLLIQRKEV